MPVIPVRSIPEAVIPAAPRPVQDRTPGWFGTTLLQPMNRRKLNRSLSAILDIARDHEANGRLQRTQVSAQRRRDTRR